MRTAFLAVGGSDEVFWTLTPRCYWTHMTAARQRLERESKDRIEQAWMTAVLSRAEKVPPLHKLFEKPEPLTGEEVLGRLRGMTRNMPKKKWKDWVAK